MSPAEELRVCWTAMPGNVGGNEAVCRYSAGGRISQHFYVACWRPRGPEDALAYLDEASAALEVRVGAKWVRASPETKPVVTNRHIRYHDTIYADFFD
jgi:hypothetical protein